MFERDKSVISRHLGHVYKTGELNKEATVAFFATVQDEGGRQVERHIEYFNLDAIISLGYRVNSKRGTQFRIWATNVLRGHLVRGFTLNEKRLRNQEQKLVDLRRTVGLLEQTLAHQAIGLDEAKGLLNVITDYAYALTTLDRFDHGTLVIEEVTRPAPFIMTYDAAMAMVKAMQPGFRGLFGLEKDQGFESALGAVYQTFCGDELYPSIEEKAANLLCTSWSRTMPSAMETNASARLCSLPSWLGTRLFTAKRAPNGLPTTLLQRSLRFTKFRSIATAESPAYATVGFCRAPSQRRRPDSVGATSTRTNRPR